MNKYLHKLSLRALLLLVSTLAMICILLVTSFVQYKISLDSLRDRQIAQGINLIMTFAEQNTLALLYNSKENSKESVSATLDYPDVVSVSVYRNDKTILLSAGAQYNDNVKISFPETAEMIGESEQAWHFMAPVAVSPNLSEDPFQEQGDASVNVYGYAHLVLSKSTVINIAKDHLYSNLIASIILGSLFLAVLVYIVNRVTRPVHDLTEIMGEVEKGRMDLRASEKGTSDIVRIQHTYNVMMDAMEASGKQLEKARDVALETARMKGEFAANVSHELRTPMNGIMGMLDILREGGGLTEKQKEHIDVAYSSANSLLELINDILDFTKIDFGKLKLKNEDFYLIDVALNVIDLMAGQANKKGVNLAIKYDPEMPDIAHGDPGRIRQVLLNLVGNAIKFTEEGEIIVTLILEEETVDNYVYKIEVRDTGIGLTSSAVSQIYEPFVQLDGSSTRQYGGSGLGLTICKQLIEMMGGEIGVESTEHVGSNFWFRIPLDIAHEAPANIDKQRTEVAGLRIMVVDPSFVVRHSLESILVSWDTFYKSVADGNAAIEQLRQAFNRSKAYDFIIIDHQLTGMPCAELVGAIKSSPQLSQIKIILTTDPGGQKTNSDLDRLIVDGRIDRPVRDIKLYQTIINIINKQSIHIPEMGRIKPVDLSGIRALVVDDKMTNQKVAVEMLNLLNVITSTASDGLEAINLFDNNNYDVIFMDCQMPVMDGYTATRTIRDLELGTEQRIPIVAMSANARIDDEERCMQSGMDAFLEKPLMGSQIFRDIIEKVIPPEKRNSFMNLNFISDERALNSDVPINQTSGAASLSLNMEALNSLITIIGVKPVRDMIYAFSEETPRNLEKLSEAMKFNDRRVIGEIAHSIKSSAQNFGAERLAKLCKELEHKAISEDLSELTSISNSIQVAGYDLMRELHEMSENNESIMGDLERYAILIVDDDKTSRIAMENVLKADEYYVVFAETAAEAVSICIESIPDLLMINAAITDPNNTNVNGYTTCRKIKELPDAESLPVLMITSQDDPQAVEAAFEANATDLITKPFNYSILKRRVNQLLHARKSEKRINKITFTDELTGLPNRAHFINRLSSLIKNSVATHTKFSVLFLDLNNFKLINDTMGHRNGDIILSSVANRLQTVLRDKDMVSRISGDDFTIIVDGVNTEDHIKKIAEKVCNEINKPFYIRDDEINITANIGIAMYPEHGEELDLLMKRSDVAMYFAKDESTRIMVFDESMETKISEKMTIVSHMKKAIENEKFKLYYQPQLDLKTGKIIGAEALVRWTHEGKTLMPNEFISHAEDSGLIVELGEWILLEACNQLKTWNNKGIKPFKMAVNISVKQLEDPMLTEKIAMILNDTGIEDGQLQLEITESAIMKKPEQSAEVLHGLCNMGIDIAIDDFCTGFNTISHLDNFPVSVLKIDKYFIMKIDENNKPNIVKGIISLANSLGLKVVAEGVENECQKNFLKELDCDLIQGYLLSRPIPSAIFEQKILRKGKARIIESNIIKPSPGTFSSDTNDLDKL